MSANQEIGQEIGGSMERIARNPPGASDNLIHDDMEAQKYGYKGALVPGVTLYAYMTQLILPVLGEQWLQSGYATLRCLRPVYEGDALTCVLDAFATTSDTLTVRCLTASGAVAADMTATLLAPERPPMSTVATDAPASPLPLLTPATVPLHQPLSTLVVHLGGDEASAYARETYDESPLLLGVTGKQAAAPGWLAGRQARTLRHNFRYGPSIHTASRIWHLAAGPVPAEYQTGGEIVETFERNGHHYLVFNALTRADGRPVCHILHTVIYQVRAS